MDEVVKKMKKVFRGLNSKVIGFVQAVATARRLKVRVSFLPGMNNDGYYIPPEKSYDGKPQIFIKAELSEQKQAQKIVHELTHHICHVALNLVLFSQSSEYLTEMGKQQNFLRNKHEYEANIIEAISAIPQKHLKNATRGLFEIEDEDLQETWRIRLIANEKHRL